MVVSYFANRPGPGGHVPPDLSVVDRRGVRCWKCGAKGSWYGFLKSAGISQPIEYAEGVYFGVSQGTVRPALRHVKPPPPKPPRRATSYLVLAEDNAREGWTLADTYSYGTDAVVLRFEREGEKTLLCLGSNFECGIVDSRNGRFSRQLPQLHLFRHAFGGAFPHREAMHHKRFFPLGPGHKKRPDTAFRRKMLFDAANVSQLPRKTDAGASVEAVLDHEIPVVEKKLPESCRPTPLGLRQDRQVKPYNQPAHFEFLSVHGR